MREVAAGADDHALAAVDLAGGRNADAGEAFHRDVLGGQKLFGGFAHGGEDGRLVAVKADARFAFCQHLAGFIHNAQLDGRAADVNAKILFHAAFSVTSSWR